MDKILKKAIKGGYKISRESPFVENSESHISWFKEKKIKAWIWCYGLDENPQISFTRPLAREIKNGLLYDTKVYKCTITYKV